MKQQPIKPQRQKGIALLVVMLIIVLMIMVAGHLSTRLGTDISRVSEVQDQADNWQRLLSGEALAVAVLRYDLERSTQLSLSQHWASRDINLPISGGMISGKIIDKGTCFNLNALGQPNDRSGQSMVQILFRQLLLVQGVPSGQARRIAAATRDWIDENQSPTNYGGEDRLYQKQGYQTDNSPMVSKSQWRSVRGVTAEIYERVSPLLCALPTQRLAIDINTIDESDAPLLEMLFYGQLDHNAAVNIIRRRPRQGYQRVLQLVASPELSKVRLDRGILRTMTTTSRYFEAQLEARSADGVVSSLHSLITRRGISNMHVIRRELGDWD